MDLGNTVVILGAGASRGARVDGQRTPPLDTEFLSVAGNVFRHLRGNGRNRKPVRAWREFQTHLSAAGLKYEEIKSWRLEQLSTFLEARSNLPGLQLSAGRPRKYAQALAKLKEVVGHTLVKLRLILSPHTRWQTSLFNDCRFASARLPMPLLGGAFSTGVLGEPNDDVEIPDRRHESRLFQTPPPCPKRSVRNLPR